MKKIELANKELESFLRKEKVFTRFCRNFIKRYGRKSANNISKREYLKLTACFIFYETPEGHDFWQNLDYKYELQTKQSCQK